MKETGNEVESDQYEIAYSKEQNNKENYCVWESKYEGIKKIVKTGYRVSL